MKHRLNIRLSYTSLIYHATGWWPAMLYLISGYVSEATDLDVYAHEHYKGEVN